jgi:hypothetical protein
MELKATAQLLQALQLGFMLQKALSRGVIARFEVWSLSVVLAYFCS